MQLREMRSSRNSSEPAGMTSRKLSPEPLHFSSTSRSVETSSLVPRISRSPGARGGRGGQGGAEGAAGGDGAGVEGGEAGGGGMGEAPM